MDVIIIIILALLVLAILIYVITKGSGNFITGTGSCEGKGGHCIKDGENCNILNESMISSDECKNKGAEYNKTGKCCIGVPI